MNYIIELCHQQQILLSVQPPLHSSDVLSWLIYCSFSGFRSGGSRLFKGISVGPDNASIAANGVLPATWNTCKDVYTFRFELLLSRSLQCVVKCVPVQDRFMIHAVIVGHGKSQCKLTLHIQAFQTLFNTIHINDSNTSASSLQEMLCSPLVHDIVQRVIHTLCLPLHTHASAQRQLHTQSQPIYQQLHELLARNCLTHLVEGARDWSGSNTIPPGSESGSLSSAHFSSSHVKLLILTIHQILLSHHFQL